MLNHLLEHNRYFLVYSWQRRDEIFDYYNADEADKQARKWRRAIDISEIQMTNTEQLFQTVKVNSLLYLSLMELNSDPTLPTNGSRKAAKVHMELRSSPGPGETLYGFSSRKGT